MEPKEFTRRLDELRSIISDGIAYFVAWRELMVEDDESAHALNRYRGLFLPARGALLWMAFMQFNKVFDRDQRTVSLRNLLSIAKTNQVELTPNATVEDLKYIEEQVDKNEELLERLKRLRDQRIAHHDAISSGDRSVLYGEVQKLVDDIKSMYNKLRSGHDGVFTAFDYIVRDAERHTSEVAQIMRDERDRAVRQSREVDTS